MQQLCPMTYDAWLNGTSSGGDYWEAARGSGAPQRAQATEGRAGRSTAYHLHSAKILIMRDKSSL
jgi:hypothetical protein